MRINDKKKYIHVHIPRTGGTSLTRIMDARPIRPEHAYLSSVDFGSRDLDKYTVIVFVRNAWDWEHSIWAHSHKKGKAWSWDEYIEYRQDHPRRQSDFVRLNFKLRFDWVGRFENYARDVKRCRKDFGLKGELPHLRYMDKPGYREAYSDRQRDIIGNIHRHDIALFGWEF